MINFRQICDELKFEPQVVFEVGVYVPEYCHVIDFIPTARAVHLFEPHAACFEKLKAAFGNRKNVSIHNAAIYHTEGHIKLFDRQAGTFAEGIISPAKINGQYVEDDKHSFLVPASRFDAHDPGDIDLLAVDTEGCEWFVLQRLVSRPAIICLETHGKSYINKFWADIMKWMNENGYTLYDRDEMDSVYVRNQLLSGAQVQGSREKTSSHVAILLQGGIGGHLQGLRILPFVRNAYPGRRLYAYSLAGDGNLPLVELCKMSPYLDQVEMVPADRSADDLRQVRRIDGLGFGISGIRREDRDRILGSADIFTADSTMFFIPESRRLGVSFHAILNQRPELELQHHDQPDLSPFGGGARGQPYVVLSLAGSNPLMITRMKPWLKMFLGEILAMEGRAGIALLHTTQYDYPHADGGVSNEKRKRDADLLGTLMELAETNPRIAVFNNLALRDAAVLIGRSRYLVSANSALCELARSFNVDSSCILVTTPNIFEIGQSLPEFHNVLLIGRTGDALTGHFDRIVGALGRN